MNTSRDPLQIVVLLVKLICAQCCAPDCGAAVNLRRFYESRSRRGIAKEVRSVDPY